MKTHDNEIICALSGSDLPDCPSSGNLHNCFGTYTYAQGSKYVGEFKNDAFNRQGNLAYADGTVQEGKWKDDKFVGK